MSDTRIAFGKDTPCPCEYTPPEVSVPSSRLENIDGLTMGQALGLFWARLRNGLRGTPAPN